MGFSWFTRRTLSRASRGSNLVFQRGGFCLHAVRTEQVENSQQRKVSSILGDWRKESPYGTSFP